MTKPKLLFLSWEYPYRPGEAPFITPALPALTAAFDLRLRACLNTGTRAESPVPCPVPFAPAQKGSTVAAAFYLLFDGHFFREILGIFKRGGGCSALRTRLGIAFYSYLHAHQFALGLYADCKKNGFIPDLGYSFWGQEGAYALVLLKKRFPKMGIVSRFHGCDLYLERGKTGYLPFRRAFSEKLDQLYFISRQGLSYYKDTYAPLSEDRLSLSLLGCLPTESRVRPDFEKLVLVTCARVAPEKRMGLLVESLALLPPSVHVEWHHMGDGPGLAALEEQAETLLAKKENITRIFHGRVENAALRPLYERIGARLLVNTSVSEGLPVTMMEAFSMGIPVMGTNVGGVSELVSEDTGVLLPSNPSPEQVAAALTDFANLPKCHWERRSANCRSLWEQSLNAEKNAKAFADQLLALITR